MSAPDTICQLVDRFRYNLHEYKNPHYSETQVRVEFINPFWEALGWDVLNKSGNAMAYRDVIHEAQIKVGSSTKAPDYAFKVGKERIFFLEAKKPSRDLKNDPEPAFQLRRYAYSARLPISILTDFEELSVYDTRLKPAITDKSNVGRMLYYHFSDYLEKWGEIAEAFSKEAVMRGAFDRFVDDQTKGRGTTTLDRDFLNSLDEWRINLAHNIALRNPDLSERELNYAVQMTIDRLIFLRMAEDRGIETYGTLQALQNGENCYRRLVQVYYHADERYNSGLFHFEERDGAHPDVITPSLEVDDKVLKEIIRNLYYPCPYEFSQLPVEVLGNAYEQFLGKRITLTGGHRARIEEKPEVRKAGGVYYTPQYIVDYIVEHTVGELVKDKTPRQISELRILDPACGSGSFLLGAYQYLLDWHLKAYIAEHQETGIIPSSPPAKGQRARKSDPQAMFQDRDGQWALSTAEKKRILLNNIYGVDIDANAVEVTKLSLLLKVLEDENSETLHQQLGLWHERALPNLSGNIKCGNSLIGPDYYDNQQSALFDIDERIRVNAFDWRSQFADVFAQGGFNVVIGNPPYFSAVTLEKEYQKYLSKNYGKLWASRNDISYYFLIHAIRICRGIVSFIMPRYYLNSYYACEIREFLATKGKIKIVDTGNHQCFPGVNILTTIFKIAIGSDLGINYYFANNQKNSINIENILEISRKKISSDNWNFNPYNILLEKIASTDLVLGDFFLIAKGMSTGLNSAFEIKGDIAVNFSDRSYLRHLIKNGDIRRYTVLDKGERYVLYLENVSSLNDTPEYKKHLLQFYDALKSRKSAYGKWFHYSTARNKDLWERNTTKIVVPFMATENRFALEERNVVSTSGDVSALIMKNSDNEYDLKYFLGILNSKVLFFFHRNTTKLKRGGYMEYVSKQLNKLPIRKIDFTNPDDKAKHDRLVTLVQQMLDLHKTLTAARDPRSCEQLERQIEATDKQIDRLVYELYELTDEEIKIVEESTAKK